MLGIVDRQPEGESDAALLGGWIRAHENRVATRHLPTARAEVVIVYAYRRGHWPMQPEVRVGGTMVPMNPISNPCDERCP